MNACVRVNFLDQQGNTGGGDSTDNTSTDKVGSTGVSGGGGTVGTVGGVGSVSGGHGGSGGQSEDNGLELHFWLVREVCLRSGGTPFYIFSRRCLHGVIIALRFSFSFHPKWPMCRLLISTLHPQFSQNSSGCAGTAGRGAGRASDPAYRFLAVLGPRIDNHLARGPKHGAGE